MSRRVPDWDYWGPGPGFPWVAWIALGGLLFHTCAMQTRWDGLEARVAKLEFEERERVTFKDFADEVKRLRAAYGPSEPEAP